jgi:biopolymer transport protein ExbD
VRRRRRHTLDLLPLLDVFMVVLFVFATIQERELVTTSQATAELEAELRRARAAAAAAERVEQEHAAAVAAEKAAQAELAQAREQQAQLQEAMKELRAAAEQAAATGTTAGAEVLRRQNVLARLLDNFSVFEIEIDGELAGDGVINRCCFRTEPLAGEWKPCGAVPAKGEELRDWLAEGAGGLVEALRRTRGGNALTIVRQNERATSRIARSLEMQLRERLPEHKIYGEPVAVHSLACPR